MPHNEKVNGGEDGYVPVRCLVCNRWVGPGGGRGLCRRCYKRDLNGLPPRKTYQVRRLNSDGRSKPILVNLPDDILRELHHRVPAGERSGWIRRAVRERLDRERGSSGR
jgi:hypothetical protein